MATGHTNLRGCVIVILFAVLRSSVSESNVAISGTAQQSSNYDSTRWLAKQAVDGCVQTTIQSGCCSSTQAAGQKTAWWRVDLGTLISINAITTYYRDTFQQRLAGYQLYISNTTSSPQHGVLCYHDTSSTRDAVQLNVTHQCPSVGRYVTVYNSRNTPTRYDWYDTYAVLELCEVQVWGCRVGTYGDGNCANACSGNCYGGNCNATTGLCFYCFTGNYGDFCNETCSLSCKDNKCEKDRGNCYECTDGKHGYKCELVCPVNCTKCAQITEICFECITGKHGAQCELNCPVHCKDKCDKVTGNCQECIDGRHGNKCELDCPANCNGNCDQVTETVLVG
ncbi:uncharacterized protein [Argopecten irradians]|uniref:uncharacterized protein n=1 Tax=Argopecten irradians TaxID=31199 RepID=UPI003723FC5B